MNPSPWVVWTKGLGERFTSVWKLLSSTTDFLSRTPLFPQYEPILRTWRQTLQSRGGDQDVVAEIQSQVIALRTELRRSGWDLSLGSRDLACQGFRSDEALAEGFQRLVIFILEKDVVWYSGSANHVELDRVLESRCRGQKILGRHYLWYRWIRELLVLSGSATETAEDWEIFKAWAEGHKNLLLSRLKRL